MLEQVIANVIYDYSFPDPLLGYNLKYWTYNVCV